MISILLLGISTFCTDGWAIISLNKLAVFFAGNVSAAESIF